jgi:hypothetical protein
MKTIKEINAQIKELQNELKQAEHDRRLSYSRITGLNAEKIRIINENFVVIECKSVGDMKDALTNIKPFKNAWKITNGVFITSLYRIDIDNGYREQKLKIQFENNSGVLYWVCIDFNNIPKDLMEKYFISTRRGLYETEEVHVNLQAHSKAFKDIRVRSFEFQKKQQSWYGGDKTLIEESTIQDVIKDILS